MSAPAPQVRPTFGSRFWSLYELPSGEGRMPALEGVRGLAIVLVFFVHYYTLLGDYVRFDPISHATFQFLGTVGHFGVDLFFVLSGFLIYTVVLRRRTSYGQFMRRRVERIYPTFAVVFLAYVCLSLLFPDQNKIPASPAAALIYLVENAALLPGMFPITPMITVAWSLSYEFAFYAAIPLIAYGLSLQSWSSSARVKFLTILIAVYILAFMHRSTPYLRMSMFMGGMLVSEAVTSPRFTARLSGASERLVMAMLLATLPIAYVWLRHPVAADPDALAWNAPVIAIVLCTFCALVAHVVAFDGTLRRFFSQRIVRCLGNISYSFYLIHALTLKAISRAVHLYVPQLPASVFWLMLPLAFGAAVVCATLLFCTVERPLSIERRRAAVTGSPLISLESALDVVERSAYRRLT